MAKRAKSSTRKSQATYRTLRGTDHFDGAPLPLHCKFHDVTRMVSPHDHDFFEIALIVAGRGEHFTSRRRTLLAAGDVWVIRPGHWHTYMNVRHLGVWNCLIGGELFRSLAPALREDPGALELFWRGPATQARDGCCQVRLKPAERIEIERLLKQLERALHGPGAPSALQARGMLWLVLGRLAEAARCGAGANDTGARDDDGTRTPAAAQAVDFIEAYYAEDLDVAAMAEHVGLSASHLTRIFRRMTGQSPMKYLAGVRVQRACALLAETSRPVTQIAGEVGWPDPNLFARRFRQTLGLTPRQYRQQHRARG